MATILIVDDRPANREFLVSLLQYKGHRLLEADDGFKGLEAVRAERPDLVIADILMPEMDGYEFVRQIRSDPAISATRVAFWTAQYLEHEALDMAVSCGVSRILTKPSDPEQILALVSEMLSGSVATRVEEEEPNEDRQALLNDPLARSTDALKRSNLRLRAMFEMSQQLASEHDPQSLVELYCDTARRIAGAKTAVVVIVPEEENRLMHFASRGLGCGCIEAIEPKPPFGGIVAEALLHVRPVRVNGRPLTLFPSCPCFQSALVIPVASGKQVYGWLCLGDKVGWDGFNDDDEEAAVTLTAQFAACLENSVLYRKLEERNVELQGQIEERSALENQFRHSQKMEAVGRLAGGIAHDLNNLLTVILGYTGIASESHSMGEARNSLDQVLRAGERATTLVRQLLAFSRRQVLQPRVIDLNDLIDGMQKMLRHVIEENIQLVLNLDRDLGMVMADPGQIEQVLMNLVVNARDAMPQGGAALDRHQVRQRG
jgi:two-component system cell cycle sensor histidine kinase/response regulator CckA